MILERRRLLALLSGAALAPRAIADEPGEPALPDGWGSRFARGADGVRLHYVVAGSGPPVVLLHGWPQTSFAWRGTMERLAARFTLIAPDLRGLGRSERPAAGYDKRTIAADICALVAAAAGGRAAIVGHDMGGKAAYVMAHLHPECVGRLVLVDCLIPGSENMDARRGGAWHYGFHMAPDIPELLTRGRERDYIAAQIGAWSHREGAVSAAAIDEFARHYATLGGMTAGFAYYRALPEDARLVAAFGARRLAMPVLAIAGRQGVGSRLAEALRPIADDLASEIVEDCGHFVPDEAPDRFCAALLRFLSA
jgi:pimeloyl-ACP methyl ester carboxylesterase